MLRYQALEQEFESLSVPPGTLNVITPGVQAVPPDQESGYRDSPTLPRVRNLCSQRLHILAVVENGDSHSLFMRLDAVKCLLHFITRDLQIIGRRIR